MAQFLKPTETPVSTRQEIQTSVILEESNLTYTLCDRTDLSNKLTNYFISFNLPYESDDFSLSSFLSTTKPELQQLNVDKMVITPIDRAFYNEIIDGRSITFKVPQYSGGTGGTVTYKTLVSSTYSTLEKKQNSELLGSNVSFLFSDDVNKPYTGTTSGGLVDKSSNTTWNPDDSYVNRPPAVSYTDLEVSDINSDSRIFTAQTVAVEVGNAYPNNVDTNYNYDIPVGFAALDKGWMILTHPDVVDNIPWSEGLDKDGNPNLSSGTTEIHFADTNVSNLYFVDINVEYKTSVIALVFPGEFFHTTNPTWDREKNYQEQQAGTFGYDPISISEIGLYNSKNQLIAISKLDRPLVKQYNDLVTFTLDINL